MTPRLSSGIPAWFWERASRAAHLLLMCDYDGTLAPSRAERSEACPDPQVLDLLRDIASSPRTTVAIVTGRPTLELYPRIRALSAWLVGEHGWEITNPDGESVRYPLAENFQQALDTAAEAAKARGWGSRLERRRTAIFLRTRGLPSGEASDLQFACALAWLRWRAAARMELAPADGGIELRAPGRDKGTAVMDLLSCSPAGTYPVYLGDDETDEEAFSVLRDRGLGIVVGPRHRRTQARGRIDSQAGIVGFLESWLAKILGQPASVGVAS